MKRCAIFSCLVFCICGGVAIGCGSPNGSSEISGATSTGTASPATATSATPATVATTTSLAATSTTQVSPAELLLEGMTLRQKAAQVLLLAIDGTTLSAGTRELLAEGPPAGILLLERNITGTAQIRALTSALQQAAADLGSGIEMFMAVDQEGGSVQRLRKGVPDVPAARTLGESSSPAEAGRLAAETAAGLLDLGVNMNLAPVADVVADKTSFLYRRSYGGDAALVADFVAAVTKAFSRGGLISVVKHFPGHGSASGDTHGEEVISDATRADFEAIHLPPFRAALAAGADGVMMAHIVATAYDPERPASQSASIISGLLRGDLGFTGLVIADDLEMAAAGSNGTREGAAPGEAAVAALEAGCDLLISTGTLARQLQIRDAIVEAVRTGRLAPSRLDEAVLQVVALKLRHGIVAPLR